MSCRQEIASGSGVTPLGPGQPGGVLPPGVVPNTFLQWNGVLWVPSSWTLPDSALAGDVGEVLTAAGANASDWAAPPVLPATTAYHYAFAAQQVNTGTQALFPFYSTQAATGAIGVAVGAIAQFTGTLQNMWVTHGTPTGADNIVYTVLRNGFATDLAVTLNSGAGGPATNLANIVAVNPGDKIVVRTTGVTVNRPCVPRVQFLLVAGAPPVTPSTIMAGNIVAGWDAASLAATPVAAWPDLGPGGFTLTAAGAAQPTWNAAGGPNGQPSVLFNGTTNWMTNAALDLPAPNVTRTFYWAVMRQVTWTSSRILWTTGGTLDAINVGASPAFVMRNPTQVNSNAGLTLNTYRRVEVSFTGSTADHIKAGATLSTGASAGTNNPTAGFTLGAQITGTSAFSNIEICELWIFNATPDATQLAALDAYVTNRYGPGLV